VVRKTYPINKTLNTNIHITGILSRKYNSENIKLCDMKQQHIDRIKKMVTDVGIRETLNLFGGNKDIIRKVYSDNPISYLDNLKHKPYVYKAADRILFKVRGDRNYNFAWVDLGNDHIIINNTITDFKFYESIMGLDTSQTCNLIKGWLDKHYDGFVEIKNLSPLPLEIKNLSPLPHYYNETSTY
jgi:hypothetical protein